MDTVPDGKRFFNAENFKRKPCLCFGFDRKRID